MVIAGLRILVYTRITVVALLVTRSCRFTTRGWFCTFTRLRLPVGYAVRTRFTLVAGYTPTFTVVTAHAHTRLPAPFTHFGLFVRYGCVRLPAFTHGLPFTVAVPTHGLRLLPHCGLLRASLFWLHGYTFTTFTLFWTILQFTHTHLYRLLHYGLRLLRLHFTTRCGYTTFVYILRVCVCTHAVCSRFVYIWLLRYGYTTTFTRICCGYPTQFPRVWRSRLHYTVVVWLHARLRLFTRLPTVLVVPVIQFATVFF